jgi:hypothetical protein
VDAFIVSDALAARYPRKIWGANIPELSSLQDRIEAALHSHPELQGLRRPGFGFRIFTQEQAARQFGGDEIYLFGGHP